MPLRPLLTALSVAALVGPALAQDPAPAAATAEAAGGAVAVELNAMRQVGDVCQAYFVVHNEVGAALSALELDAFMFDAKGVIVDRLALPFPPVDAGRMKVMVFDLNLACTDVTRVFVNEVLACESGAGTCAGNVALSSRAAAELAD